MFSRNKMGQLLTKEPEPNPIQYHQWATKEFSSLNTSPVVDKGVDKEPLPTHERTQIPPVAIARQIREANLPKKDPKDEVAVAKCVSEMEKLVADAIYKGESQVRLCPNYPYEMNADSRELIKKRMIVLGYKLKRPIGSYYVEWSLY